MATGDIFFRISFFLNRNLVTCTVAPDELALDVLREKFGLTGTKEGCREGDCGACTIAVGQIYETGVRYCAINSCLFSALRMHGAHIVTVEGLAEDNTLHPVQDAMVNNGAIQCGFCTPGIEMSLFCLFLENPHPSHEQLLSALEGNICRCTGYKAIADAAAEVESFWEKNFVPSYFEKIHAQMAKFSIKPRIVVGEQKMRKVKKFFAPENEAELFEILSAPDCENSTIFAGGTDIFVSINVRGANFTSLVDISHIPRLKKIDIDEQVLRIGSGTTITQVIENQKVAALFPIVPQALAKMASKQVRNVATLAGNIANASPIADSFVLLMALDARLILERKFFSNEILPEGAVVEQREGGFAVRKRTVALTNFCCAYKKTLLECGELITAIEIPLTMQNWLASFEKSAKREALDIATVNSACTVRIENGKIAQMRLVFGGVAPIPVFATECCAFAANKNFTYEFADVLAEIVANEVSPISDVRGSAEFRRTLVKNHIRLHFTSIFAQQNILR